MTLDDYARRAGDLAARRAAAKKVLAQAKQEDEEAKAGLAAAVGCRAIVQGVAAGVQQVAHQRIADLVTRCLAAVFGEDAYEFRIVFEKKRGRTEARLAFVRGGVEYDPLGSAGGGVVDVAAFALRLACLVWTRPRKRLLLILDEPTKHLSSDYAPRFAELLLKLAGELKIQFVVVTHNEELCVGKVVRLG